MPEWPDIEANGRDIQARALQRRIDSVDLHDPPSLRGSRPADLAAALQGYQFEGVHHHGKVLFLKVSCGWQLAVHFGMTGRLVLYERDGDAPAHARVVLGFADGGRLAFDCMRKLGWVELTDDIPHYLRQQDIGPDALTFSRDGFRGLLESKRGMVKTALTDQARIAGIGNVYADEVLFQAGLRPDRKTETLDRAEVDRLHATIREVLARAADLGGDPERLPDGWLTPRRARPAPACPACGRGLDSRKVSGRTAWLCPSCQS